MLLKGGRGVHRLGKESAMARVMLKGRSITKGREDQYSVEKVLPYDSASRVLGRLLENGEYVRDFDVKVTNSRFKVDIGTGSGVKVEFSLLNLQPMSHQRIGLARLPMPYGDSLVPDEGESLAKELIRAADQNEHWADMKQDYHGLHFLRLASTLLYLAADAYDFAGLASIGHNRTARYKEQEDGLRKRATVLFERHRELRKKLDTESAMRRAEA